MVIAKGSDKIQIAMSMGQYLDSQEHQTVPG